MVPESIFIELPSDKELHEMYYIRDDGDYKVLYSAEKTGSVSNTYDTGFKDRIIGGIPSDL